MMTNRDNRKPTIEELNRLRERERQQLGLEGVQWFSVGDDNATPNPDAEANDE